MCQSYLFSLYKFHSSTHFFFIRTKHGSAETPTAQPRNKPNRRRTPANLSTERKKTLISFNKQIKSYKNFWKFFKRKIYTLKIYNIPLKASPNGRETSNKATRYYITTQSCSGIDATAYKINSVNRKIISSKTELYINNTLSHFNITILSWSENDNTPHVNRRK